MHGIRSLAFVLLAVLGTAFAMNATAAAPEKKFSVAISPNLLSAGSAPLTIRIKNETPNGNSSINSLVLHFPSGYTLDATAPLNVNWSAQVSSTATSVSLSNMAPLKPQQSFTITLNANTPAASVSATSCAAATWSADAWTGSSFSGDTFRQLFPPEFNVNSTTSIGSPQQLAFSTPPPSQVLVNQAFSMGVTVSTTCGPVNSAKVTITPDCTDGCLVGTTQGTTNSSGVATFTDLALTQTGTYTLTASSDGFPPVSATIIVYEGLLNCDPTPPYSFTSLPPGVTNSSQSGYAAGQRGRYNKDGSTCKPVDYVFVNSILTPNSITGLDNTVHLIWDTVTDPYATFTYTMTWKTEDVDAGAANDNAGWPVFRRPLVAWETVDGIVPKFVPAVACIGSDLPAPYATLTTAISNSTPAIQIAVPSPLPQFWATLPSTASFPLVVGNERMNVTAMTLASAGPPAIYNLTVTRHDGMPATRAAAWPPGQLVMSTPLPIDLNPTSPYFQSQANICVTNHGWMAAGINHATGLAQIRYFTTVIDIGDGWVTIPR